MKKNYEGLVEYQSVDKKAEGDGGSAVSPGKELREKPLMMQRRKEVGSAQNDVVVSG